LDDEIGDVQFRIKYLRRGSSEPCEAVIDGPDERSVGWAVIQRGDRLLSVEPVRSSSPAKSSQPRVARRPPAQPINAGVLYAVVAGLLLVGAAMPVRNYSWMLFARDAYNGAVADLEHAERRLQEEGPGFSYAYRLELEQAYLPPRREKVDRARSELLMSLAHCATGVGVMFAALWLAHRYRAGVQRWNAWTSRANGREPAPAG
jgi:hypothetical protein